MITGCGQPGFPPCPQAPDLPQVAMWPYDFHTSSPGRPQCLRARARAVVPKVHTLSTDFLWITSFVPTSGDESPGDYRLLTGLAHNLWITSGDLLWTSCGCFRRVTLRRRNVSVVWALRFPQRWTNPGDYRWTTGGQRLWTIARPQSTGLYTPLHAQVILSQPSGLTCENDGFPQNPHPL